MYRNSGCVVSKFRSLPMSCLKVVYLPHITSHLQEIWTMTYYIYTHNNQVLQAFLDTSMDELKPEIKLNLGHSCITWMHCLIAPSILTVFAISFAEVLNTCIKTVQHNFIRF